MPSLVPKPVTPWRKSATPEAHYLMPEFGYLLTAASYPMPEFGYLMTAASYPMREASHLVTVAGSRGPKDSYLQP
jgi:hypothetical protein